MAGFSCILPAHIFFRNDTSTLLAARTFRIRGTFDSNNLRNDCRRTVCANANETS